MYVNDPIADMLTRIRNAQMAEHPLLEVPESKIKLKIVSLLKEEGFIESFEKVDVKDKPYSVLKISLKYNAKTGKPIISEIKRVSKLGRRVYTKASDLQPYKNGYGVYILTTSKGIITDKKARELNIGGEVICSVW